jgi:arginine/ornithine succinyltransferase subunit-like protein
VPSWSVRRVGTQFPAACCSSPAIRSAFADSVVTEIVGYSDENGDSPFWDAIGRNFFDLNYAAPSACGLKSRTFLAELMPHYPIYVPLLPDEAQEDGPGAPACRSPSTS